jgi:hypothetical protein
VSAAWIRIPLKSFRERIARKALLCSLTPPEKQIIADYINRETDTQYFNPTDGVSDGLAAKGLIYPKVLPEQISRRNLRLQCSAVGTGNNQKESRHNTGIRCWDSKSKIGKVKGIAPCNLASSRRLAYLKRLSSVFTLNAYFC